MNGLLGNLASIVKRGAFGGLLQSDEDLLKQYVPEQYLQTMTPEQSAQAAQKARGIASAALFSPRVDANERTQLVQNALLGDIAGRQQLQQKQQLEQLEQARQNYVSKMTAPTVTPEMALEPGNMRVGPTPERAAAIGQANPNRLSEPKANAEALRQIANRLMVTNPAQAEKYLEMAGKLDPKQDSIFDKVDVSKFDPASVRKFVQTQDYGDLVAKSDEPEAIRTLRILQQNPDLAALSASQKRAGATVVAPSFKLGNTFGEDVVKGIAGNVMGQVDAATAAADTVATVQNMRQALPKAITGTGANARIALARLGQTIGVGGRDDAESLAATSQVIQGLAKTQLNAAQANKGQGTFTDFERKLLSQAASGDINMTPRELDALFNAVEKGARKQYEIGAKQVSKMQQTPMFGQVAPFMALPDLPALQQNTDPLGLRGKQ